jgi:hypothetical protein
MKNQPRERTGKSFISVETAGKNSEQSIGLLVLHLT